MENQGERIAKLEVIVNEHEKKLVNHEDRLDEMEKINLVISKINDNIEKQAVNISSTNESVKSLLTAIQNIQETTSSLQNWKHDYELLQKHSFGNYLKESIKKVSIKEWITFVIFLAGVITALVKLLG